MNFTEYQKSAITTKKFWDEKQLELSYCALGLCGEAGEVAEFIKKHILGTKPLDTDRLEKLKYELGDVLWYIAALCDALDFDMGEVAQMNVNKLRKRHGESFSGHGNRVGE